MSPPKEDKMGGMKKDNITMSKKQLVRFDILSKANAGFITVREAAEALGLSERQVKRLKKKVREDGADGVIHGNSGKPPVNKITDETKEKILKLRKLPGNENSNFFHFTEILERDYGMFVSHVSVGAILEEEGIKSPKTKRRYKAHRRRKRKDQAGLLLQIDASAHTWFIGDRKVNTIHGAIDDATGQVTGLYMTKNECLHGYFELFRRTIGNYGIPVSIYADRHTIFQSPNSKKHEIDTSVAKNDTQLGRCMKDLEITLIPARSPQAKGRVERLWGTLQDRLPVEFARLKIKTVEEANAFLETYIYEFNANFAVEPKNTQNAFRKLDDDENVDYILCVKEKRLIDAGGVFSYGGKSFKIIDDELALPAKTHIDVMIGSRFGVMAAYKGHIMEALPFVPPKRRRNLKASMKPRIQTPPPPEHAWNDGIIENIITISDIKFEREETYYETVRLIEKTLLGKYR